MGSSRKISVKKANLQQAKTLPILGSLKARRLTFPNGLKVLFVRRTLSPTFSYQTWYNVGSRDEELKFTGMAHLFEHMMFKGTKKNKQGVFDRILSEEGCQGLNAMTSTDFTAYVGSLPKSALPIVAGLESDRMTGLVLHKKPFESEREVVHNERKETSENQPEGKLYEALNMLAFQKHSYGWPIIGFEKDLNRMTTKDLVRFYKKFYAPNNATIVIVGDLTEEEVVKTIHKFYGSIPPSTLETVAPPVEDKQEEERYKEIPLKIHLEKIDIGYKVPAIDHHDRIALSMLDYILTGGRSSRLYQALVNSEQAIDVSSYIQQGKDPGLFYLFLSLQANKKSRDALDIIDKELLRIEKKGVSASELLRAKNKILMNFHLTIKNNSSICYLLGEGETIYGDFTKEIPNPDSLSRLTSAHIQELIPRYFRKHNRSIVIGKPQA